MPQATFDHCYVLHGCPPSPDNIIPQDQRWMNWLAGELTTLGYDAVAPDMPTGWAPVYEEWKKVFEKFTVTENTVLVGHSCGAAFLVRWLLETGTVVKKLILVAPAKVPEKEDDPRNAMYEFEFPEEVPYLAEEVVVFTSNDFPHHLQALELYKKHLQPRVIELENKGHFLIFTMGTPKFPELLTEVLATK